MGAKIATRFQLSFDGFLKVDFQDSRFTSNGGLLLVQELDERLGLGKLIDQHLIALRSGENKKSPLADWVRLSVYSHLAGYGVSTTPWVSQLIRSFDCLTRRRTGMAAGR